MSMLSAQIDELRQVAQVYRNLGKHATEQMLLDAADTILELRDDLQRANAENAKLRELVLYMWDFSCVVPDEPHTSKEELDYSVEVWKRMRELGVES